jgi:hypothetical protein
MFLPVGVQLGPRSSATSIGHLEEQRPLVGGVAITISGRGSIPIRVWRPIRIRVTVGVGVTVVGSRGYCCPEEAKPDAETNSWSDAPTATMMVPTTAPTSPTMPTAIGK